MLLKCVLLLTAASMLVNASPVQLRNTPYELVSVVALEEPCVRQGGICMKVDDCDPSHLVSFKSVLCPQQSHLDVECCYI